MMEHIIYKTTNILNGRFYIGMHSTENIDDGYLGSGRRVKAEVKKYGKKNFVREVLEYLPSREALCARETEIVCEELLSNPLCLNLKNGGEGGGKFSSVEHQRKCSLAGVKATKEKWKSDPQFRKAGCQRASAEMKKKHTEGKIRYDTFKNKHLGDNHRSKIGKKSSEHQTGEGNSQFGTCWVTDGVKPVKIKKEQLDEYLVKGFRRGR
ncbi:hypothetical protein [Acinetobacter sp.]|uniref:hypothetical protein n=1 Tax=Acinetobacter sp. TaxID=472 RepID=UPI00388D7F22